MAAPQYHFVSYWRFTAAPENVFAIIANPQDYPRWWGEVYLSAETISEGDPDGLGRKIRVVSKGKFNYKVQWDMEILEIKTPARIVIRASGDFDGRGECYIAADGKNCDVMFDWRLVANKPALKYLPLIMKPLFKANHKWAMEQGRLGLDRELASLRDAVQS